MRDAIYNKWGQCFDLEFQPVTTFGFRELYLNVMPFRLGGKRFRHKTELDYLCHLQAVVSNLKAQVNETVTLQFIIQCVTQKNNVIFVDIDIQLKKYSYCVFVW